MNKDPLDLFDDEGDGKSQPVVVRDTSGSSSSFLTLVIGVLLGIAAVGFYQRNFGDSDGGDDRKRDDQEQVEPDDGQRGFSGDFLLFIHGRKPLSIADDLLLQQVEAWTDTVDGLEWRSWDDDDPSKAVRDAIEWASSKGVEPPLMVWKSTDDGFRKAIKFPSDIDQVKKAVR